MMFELFQNYTDTCGGRAHFQITLQIPWHALRGRLLSISLTDVDLCAAPRPESDWEEGPSQKRAHAAKRALLAAVEMERLSKPAVSADADRGAMSSTTDSTGTLPLNKLRSV